MRKKLFVVNIMMLIVLGLLTRQNHERTVPVTTQTDIRGAVESYIEANEMKPMEPRLDPVWHFVPGIEGITFDYELSLQNMLSHGAFNPELMVAKRIPLAEDAETFRAHRLYRGHEKSPYIGLLINVAWGGDELLEMLDILDEHDVRASVFFEGKFAYANPQMVQEVFNRGHIVGNHSYSHPANWLELSYDGFLEEITKTNNILSEITGEPLVYFAPPGGAFNDDTIRAAYDLGMYTVMWSADTIDWRGEPADVLINRINDRITPGGLILTHPKPETVIALPTIIDNMHQLGYEFATIEQIVHGQRADFSICKHTLQKTIE